MSVKKDPVDSVLEATQIIVQNEIKNAGFDKTIQATVMSCVDQSIGKYKVKYQDGYWIAYSSNTNVTYPPNTNVYVLIPKGDMTQDKTIIGTTKQLGVNYVTITGEEEHYEVVGNSIVSSSEVYGLCSYKTQTKILYSENIVDSNFYVDAEAATQYIKNSAALKVSFNVRNDLKNQQQYQGNYGITFGLQFLDKATQDPEDTVIHYYTLDVDSMQGDPYFFPNETRQYKIFKEIDVERFVRIVSVELFVKDFPNQKANQPNDIFISQIELNGVVLINEEDLNSYALIIHSPKGYIFSGGSSTDKRTFQAELRVQGKVVNFDSQQVQFYWFRENIGITAASEKYSKYGGQGWECLNNFTVAFHSNDPAIPDRLDFQPDDDNIFQVTKSQVAAYLTKYKCVAIYQEKSISKEFKVINKDSNYKIEITSSNGTHFYNNIGKTTLTCSCLQKSGSTYTEMSSSIIKFVWAVIDNNGQFVSLSNNTNQIQNLQIREIVNHSTYKCSVFNVNGNVFLGTGEITLINSDNNSGYNVIINNGNQIFKYSTTGLSPASKQQKSPITIPSLSFTVYDHEGTAIENDIIRTGEISWIIPITDTMLRVTDYEGGENNDELNIVSYKNLSTLTYSIAENYNMNFTRNTIELHIKYKGFLLKAKTNFSFLKEGESGTNGTDFVCRIIPNVTEGDIPVHPTIYYDGSSYTLNWTTNSNKWFKVQLWHNGNLPIFSGTESDVSSEGKNVTVEKWQVLRNKYFSIPDNNNNLVEISDNSNLVVTGDKTNWGFGFTPGAYSGSYSTSYAAFFPANILKVTVIYESMTYYATLPVIVNRIFNNSYKSDLKENTGFLSVLYNSSGLLPQYDTHAPFEIITLNNGQDISLNSNVSYKWRYHGSIKFKPDPKVSSSAFSERSQPLADETKNGEDTKSHVWLFYNKPIKTQKKNQRNLKPVDKYDGECVNIGLSCYVYVSGTLVSHIFIPIHFLRNRFENSAINSWDGNSVNLGGDNGGMILAPQVGAGIKDSNNRFTGMFIGTAKDPAEDSYTVSGFGVLPDEQIGLFGYNAGSRSIFLDAKTGKAIFGEKNQAQIIIDPSTKDSQNKPKAIIKSGNYNYNAGSYDSNIKDRINMGTGMQIDLATPTIKYGSGSFEVNENGEMISRRGEIGGWLIRDFSLINKRKQKADNTIISQGQIGMNSNPVPISAGAETINTTIPTINSSYTSLFTSDPDALKDDTESDNQYIGSAPSSTIDYTMPVPVSEKNLFLRTGYNNKKYKKNQNGSFSKETVSGYAYTGPIKVYPGEKLLIYNNLQNGDSVVNQLLILYTPPWDVEFTSDINSVVERPSVSQIKTYVDTPKNIADHHIPNQTYQEVGQTVDDEVFIINNRTVQRGGNTYYYSHILIPEGVYWISVAHNKNLDPIINRFSDIEDYQINQKMNNYVDYNSTGYSSTSLNGPNYNNIWTSSEAPIYTINNNNSYTERELYTKDGKAKAFWAGNNKFYVTHDGYLKVEQATIGSGSRPIFIKKGDDKNSAIYSGTKFSINKNAEGFYIGTDGIGIGRSQQIALDDTNPSTKTVSYFQVDPDGMLYARKGYIGNGKFGWKIGNKSLSNKKNSLNDITNAKGVYIGTDGISLGRNINGTSVAFRVNSSGSLLAQKGRIANWIIKKDCISSVVDDEDSLFYSGSNSNLGKTATKGMYFGKDGLRLGENFHVSRNGNLYAKNGQFAGRIHAKSGLIDEDVVVKGTVTAGQVQTGVINGMSIVWKELSIVTDVNITWSVDTYYGYRGTQSNYLMPINFPDGIQIKRSKMYLLLGTEKKIVKQFTHLGANVQNDTSDSDLFSSDWGD